MDVFIKCNTIKENKLLTQAITLIHLRNALCNQRRQTLYTLCFHLHEVLQKGKLIYVNKIKTVESYVGGDYLGSVNAYLNWGAAYMALYNCQN